MIRSIGSFVALSLASSALAQDVSFPGDSSDRLEDGLQAALSGVDAGPGWQSERLSEGVTRQLGQLSSWFEGESLENPTWSWVAADSELVAYSSEPVPAVGAGVEGGALTAESVELNAGTGPSGLAAWFGGWRTLGERHLKLKVVGITLSEETLETELRIELSGLREERPFAAMGFAALRWTREPLTLIRAEVSGLQAVSATAPLLKDRSRDVFGPRWVEQLEPSLAHWQRRIPSDLGITFMGHQGLAVGDVDGDELEDLFVCQPGGLPNLLYLRSADGSTREAGQAWGVDGLDAARAALLIDLDGDGDRDLALTIGGELVVHENLGDRLVERWSGEVGVSTSLASADVDADGDLDLFVCGYVDPYADETAPRPYQDARNGAPNRLFRNATFVDEESSETLWHFVDATAEVGLDANNDRFSFAASFEDYDDDGDPDLYVANDFGRNNLYRNEGGRFEDVAAALGVEDQAAGMGVSWGDADGDGRLDLYVSNMDSSAGRRVVFQRTFRERQGDVDPFVRHARGNTLFLQTDDGFRDATLEYGVERGRWAWGSLFCELDNDGRPDLVVPNGFVTGASDDDL